MDNLKKEKWVIDKTHSQIEFKIKHLMISNVKGNFNEFDASIITTGSDFKTAEIDCWINTASVDTGNADRDKHIIGADFFDAEKYPQIFFIADTYQMVDGDGSFELWGDLTIKGIKRKIKLDVEFGGVMKDPWGNEKAGFSINGKINRKDWDLNWNAALETGGVLVGEEVRISCEIQLKRAA
ncbi:MAG: polyisoprenoid-binding protein [Bacteroidetes bacterium]|nr:polyisoprenoid-binding protein [Bacteroidota bacterium]MBS1756809.1 polyisoprenoid-binding protein [Bacteroidota bacterium]